MMKARKKYSLLFLLMVVVLLLISACSQTTSGSTTSNLTPQQVLQKSSDAMKQLTSSHFVFNSNTTLHTSGAVATPTAPGQKKSSGTTQNTNNIDLLVSGSGDQISADQQQVNVSVKSGGQTLNLAEVMQGDKVYVQNPEQKWYVLDKSQFSGYASSFSGVNIDQNSLLGIVQHVRLVDHGDDTTAGPSLRHLTASLDHDALKQLLSENPQLKSSLGSMDIDTVLNNTKKFLSTVDVWIDESKFYVHRTQLKVSFDANASAVDKSAPSDVNANMNVTVDLSKFNAPVTITTPKDATPANNPSDIFGLAPIKQQQ